MKKDGLHNEAVDESRRDDATGDDAPFISDERVDEGWTVTPIGHKPGEPIPADFDPYEDDDDEDDDDPPFYTEEDYRNMPVLRRIIQDLGGEDPLANAGMAGRGFSSPFLRIGSRLACACAHLIDRPASDRPVSVTPFRP